MAVLVGGAVGGTTTALGFGDVQMALLAAAGTLGLVNLLADWLPPAGVRPFWPLSGREYSRGVTTAATPAANDRLLSLGVTVTVGGLLAIWGTQ